MVEERIKNYVNKKDKESLYLILSDYLKESFERFDENIKYVEKNLDIFQVYDGTPFEQNKEKWNKDYLFLEKGRLISNFSKERVEHIKKIIRKLYPERNKITTSYSNRIKYTGEENAFNYRLFNPRNRHRNKAKRDWETYSRL